MSILVGNRRQGVTCTATRYMLLPSNILPAPVFPASLRQEYRFPFQLLPRENRMAFESLRVKGKKMNARKFRRKMRAHCGRARSRTDARTFVTPPVQGFGTEILFNTTTRGAEIFIRGDFYAANFEVFIPR